VSSDRYLIDEGFCFDESIGGVVSVSFVRAVLMVLIVRAIFISPANGSEFGLSSHPTGSCLKKLDLVRPSRLRFTKPCAPSASLERVDCCDGGDDDERMRPAEDSVEASFSPASPRLTSAGQPSLAASHHLIVRLRC
jgi:hypothetical protein